MSATGPLERTDCNAPSQAPHDVQGRSREDEKIDASAVGGGYSGGRTSLKAVKVKGGKKKR